ncbi:MAG: response regulator [Candidatus Cloacimonetes bacterium]|nr:response regulator [Candidatus Cloacimonadota bacterium]
MSERKILLAEDEDVMRAMLVDFFTMFEYQIDEAENGRIAWDKWQEKDYQLVISDINMPEMSGVELLKKIKTEKPDFPVILITGVTVDKAKKSAEDNKANAFLSKPFKMKELLTIVQELIG